MKKLAIQEFIEQWVQTFLSLVKIMLMSSLRRKKFTSTSHNQKCIILGNGPSLSNTIQEHLNELQSSDTFGVNFFWKSEYYEQIKPKFYVIVSTNYWAKGKIDANEEGRRQTFDGIASKTNWEMTLVVPSIARKSYDWKVSLSKNKNIKIEYINITPIEGFPLFVNWALRQNFGLPRPHNVLIPSIKVAIDLNYREIFIVGADHSWLKDIYVGNDNKVYLSQKHFYDHNPAPEVMYDGTSNRIRTLADMLMKFVYSFRSYFVLKSYAESKNIKIYNATPESFIDAFERKKLL